MFSYSLAIFTGAFLVFQVQPVVARYILPWFGGSPAVWTTCMLFFQVGLLAGYYYAYLISRYLPKNRQALIHCFLLVLAILVLPIMPEKPVEDMIATQGQSQTWVILKLLFVTVGFHFILLSSTAPLLQSWFSKNYPEKSPYRLYALSNLGSLLALISYPFVIEPNLKVTEQTLFWSIGFGLFSAMSLLCAVKYYRLNVAPALPEKPSSNHSTLDRREPFLWCLFAAFGSMLLLAVTNQMCQDVAVIPFLWVLPLSIYLISFIICFERDAWYVRSIWIPFYAVSASALAYLLLDDYEDEFNLIAELLIYCSALFAGVMVCHGELTRRKPTSDKLTLFYLFVALGGALGGVFVSILAPILFDGFWELHIALGSIGCIISAVLLENREKSLENTWSIRLGLLSVCGTVLLTIALFKHMALQRDASIYNTRGFYGVLHVYEDDLGTRQHYRTMYHGRIRHGAQLMTRPTKPTTYYSRSSGAGLAINSHPRFDNNQTMNIGVVGLGVGTLATYGRAGDKIRFYEINDQAHAIAKEYFTYLNDTQAQVDIIMGDGRLSMERELTSEGSMAFDVLLVDAFSGDAIPIHLLTEEVFDIYWQHLKEDGILAIHVTNIYVDLTDVVRNLANKMNKSAFYIVDDEPTFSKADYSEWILITDNQTFMKKRELNEMSDEWFHELKPIYWSDDFSNLYDVLIW